MLQIDSQDIPTIATALREHQIVALPTETVYGLAVSLTSKPAIKKLIKLKSRDIDSGKYFTLVPESTSAISQYAQITPLAKKIIKLAVPGEVTLILPKNPNFTHFYYDQIDTIGVRIPNHPLFQELLPLSGPLLLTSANLSGAAPAQNLSEVSSALPSFLTVVKGETRGHQPSTVIDCTGAEPKVLRQGDFILPSML